MKKKRDYGHGPSGKQLNHSYGSSLFDLGHHSTLMAVMVQVENLLWLKSF